jgi:dipeptidyl-peptidase-4
MRITICLLLGVFIYPAVFSQALPEITWLNDKTFLQLTGGQIISQDLQTGEEKVFVSPRQLIPPSQREPIIPESFSISQNGQLVLLFTNTAKVWRYNTRGDYWLLNLKDNSLQKMGQKRPSQSLMFAKLSPDGRMVAYVSNKNLYVEDLSTNIEKALTADGKDKLINGTFDWVYEEEFFCRDGFRWSPDSKSIAYWQVNATGTRDFYLINNTDSIYSQVKAIEYPKVGQPISSVRIGVVNITDAKTKWMNLPGDPKNNYLVRMEWAIAPGEIIVQQLNRKQQLSRLYMCNKMTGNTTMIYEEKDSAWIDIISLWDQDYSNGGWDWLDNGKSFVWPSEKDGWRHLYAVSRDGKSETTDHKRWF